MLLVLDVAPTFIVTGSPSGLLWLDIGRRLGVPVEDCCYSRFGFAIAGPALLAATWFSQFQDPNV